MSRCLVGVLLLSAVTFGQAPPTFEVASIRPSSEQVTQVSAGLRVAGSQVRVTGMSLKDYIGMAYGVKPQQIEGPDWLGQAALRPCRHDPRRRLGRAARRRCCRRCSPIDSR